MPWQASEAKSHTKKADTPAKQSKWARVANAALKTYRGEEGAEGKAIATANASMDARYWDADVFDAETWFHDAAGKQKVRYGRHGRLQSSETEYEEEDAEDARGGSRRRTTFRIDPDLELSYEQQQEEEEDDAATVGDNMTKLSMQDAFEFDDQAKVRFIDGGYMSAYPRIARTGIQTYKGDECGRPDMETVRVYRPESEVFSKDATHSYTHLPVTNDHPGILVDAKNWGKYAKGETGDEVLRDGNSVRVPMMLRDHDTIEAYRRDDKKQLSVGYTCDLDWQQGKTAKGETYDAIQRNIRANHLAIVAAARGGPDLSIGDAEETATMTAILKTVLIDGVNVEMTDTASQIVQRAMQGLQDQIENFKKKGAKAEEEEEKAEDALKQAQDSIRVKDVEIVTLKQQLKDAEMTPAKIDEAVKARLAVIDKAIKILGKTLVTDNRSLDDIRKQVVDALVKDRPADWEARDIKVAFDMLSVKSDPIRDAVTAFGRPVQVEDAREAAYADYDKEQANAWRTGKQ